MIDVLDRGGRAHRDSRLFPVHGQPGAGRGRRDRLLDLDAQLRQPSGNGAQVFLGSAELAAACALLGRIPTPEEYLEIVSDRIAGNEDSHLPLPELRPDGGVCCCVMRGGGEQTESTVGREATPARSLLTAQGACLVLVVVSLLPLAALVLVDAEYPGDDALITLTFAKNLARGDGFIFNHPPPVLGTTSPAFTLAVAAGAAVSRAAPTSVAQWLGALCWLGLVWSFFVARSAFGLDEGQAVAIGCLLAAAGWVTHLSMEAYPFALVLVVTTTAALSRRPFVAGLCGGLLFLTRGEGVLFAAILGAAILFDGAQGSQRAGPLADAQLCRRVRASDRRVGSVRLADIRCCAAQYPGRQDRSGRVWSLGPLSGPSARGVAARMGAGPVTGWPAVADGIRPGGDRSGGDDPASEKIVALARLGSGLCRRILVVGRSRLPVVPPPHRVGARRDSGARPRGGCARRGAGPGAAAMAEHSRRVSRCDHRGRHRSIDGPDACPIPGCGKGPCLSRARPLV